MSSDESAAERLKEIAARLTPHIKLKIQPPYFDAPDYITALVASAKNYLDAGYDHLLFGFQGIPERHLRKSNPTGCHCLKVENCCEVPSPAHATCYREPCFNTVAAFVARAAVPRENTLCRSSRDSAKIHG